MISGVQTYSVLFCVSYRWFRDAYRWYRWFFWLYGPESQTQIMARAKKDFHCRITDGIVIYFRFTVNLCLGIINMELVVKYYSCVCFWKQSGSFLYSFGLKSVSTCIFGSLWLSFWKRVCRFILVVHLFGAASCLSPSLSRSLSFLR